MKSMNKLQVKYGEMNNLSEFMKKHLFWMKYSSWFYFIAKIANFISVKSINLVMLFEKPLAIRLH